MKIQVNIRENREVRTLELSEDSNAFSVIKSIGLFPDAVLVFRDGKVLPEDGPVQDGDILEIVRISSGG